MAVVITHKRDRSGLFVHVRGSSVGELVLSARDRYRPDTDLYAWLTSEFCNSGFRMLVLSINTWAPLPQWEKLLAMLTGQKVVIRWPKTATAAK